MTRFRYSLSSYTDDDAIAAVGGRIWIGTQQEFDALTDSQKTGGTVYFVSDGTNVTNVYAITEMTTPPVPGEPESPPPPPPADPEPEYTLEVVEDYDVAYSGTWAQGGSGEKYSDTATSSFTLNFTGVGFALYGVKDVHHGILEVTVDGVKQDADQYSATRALGALFYEKNGLANTSHTVTVARSGRKNAASSGTVVTFDRAIVKSTAGNPYPDVPVSSSQVVLDEQFTGSQTGYISSTGNGNSSIPFHLESGSDSINKVNNRGVKPTAQAYHRMMSKNRFGGPGKSLRIEYKGKTTEINSTTGSIPGTKLGLKFPNPNYYTGAAADDVKNVYGGARPQSPGSIQMFTGQTRNGHIETSFNPFGDGPYKFGINKQVGYTVGTEQTIIWRVDWLTDPKIRFRMWYNSESGTPVYDYTWSNTDSAYRYWPHKAFLWVRSDDVKWDIDYIKVTETDTYAVAPNASFNTSLNGLTLTCTDTSSGGPTNWVWDFGDGNTSNAQNPVHTYASSGTYTVQLVASNNVGSSTATKSVSTGVSYLGPSDNFNSGSVAAGWANKSTAVTVTSGQLVVPVSASYNNLQGPTENGTGKTLKAEIISVPTGTTSTETLLGFRVDPSNYAGLVYISSSNTLVFREEVAGVRSETNVVLDLPNMKYWRIRHLSGTNEFVWETSANNTTWTERRRKVAGISITACYARIHAGTWGTGTGNFVVDNVNI